MNKLCLTFLSASFFYIGVIPLEAGSLDHHLEQERMIIMPRYVMLLTSCADKDYITAYDLSGQLMWNVSFSTKILSWQIHPEDGYLYVFSKNRYNSNTKLTCFDPQYSSILWEKP